MERDPDERLSKAGLAELRSTLTVVLEAEIPANGDDGYPPGAVDYSARFLVRWHRYDDLQRADRDLALLAATAREQDVDLDVETVELRVGRGHFVVVDTSEPELYDALDAREGDLELLASSLFLVGDTDPESGTVLQPDFHDAIEPIGEHGILVNSASIDPRFQGAQFGLLGVGAALRELRRGCPFAALYPMVNPDGVSGGSIL